MPKTFLLIFHGFVGYSVNGVDEFTFAPQCRFENLSEAREIFEEFMD